MQFTNVTFAAHWPCGNVESSTFASHATAVSLVSISAALDQRIAPLGYRIHQMGSMVVASFLAALHALVAMTLSQIVCLSMQNMTIIMLIMMQNMTIIMKRMICFMMVVVSSIACS